MTYDPARDSILPDASTALELALEAVGHTRLVEDLDVAGTLGAIYDIDNAPSVVLDWLAWQWGMDLWDTNWTDAQKREALRNFASVQLRRGTVQSVKDAVRPWGAAVEITEWFNDTPQAAPFTFRVNIASGVADINAIAAAIDAVKPLRAHYTLSAGVNFFDGLVVGAFVRVAKLSTIRASL